ncbi:MAG: ATP-binding protein, partial [Thermodesulfobacteriota bacterium]
AGIVHQINNPLATMTLCIESLLREIKRGAIDDEKLNHKFDDYLNTVYAEIFRCKKIAGNLSYFSKSAARDRGATDVNELITDALELFTAQSRYAGYMVTTELQKDLPPITASSRLLKQAFASIIMNAFEAMEGTGGRALIITTSNAGEDGALVVGVTDTGCGIEEGTEEKIFAPFFTTKSGEGAGLGLSIAGRIVTDHGGRIEVRSEKGQGATFTVILPLEGSAG